MKDIHPREHEADVHGKEKMLVQLLKQFHTCFYQLYEKGMICVMVGLQELNLGDALRCPTFPPVWG